MDLSLFVGIVGIVITILMGLNFREVSDKYGKNNLIYSGFLEEIPRDIKEQWRRRNISLWSIFSIVYALGFFVNGFFLDTIKITYALVYMTSVGLIFLVLYSVVTFIGSFNSMKGFRANISCLLFSGVVTQLFFFTYTTFLIFYSLSSKGLTQSESSYYAAFLYISLIAIFVLYLLLFGRRTVIITGIQELDHLLESKQNTLFVTVQLNNNSQIKGRLRGIYKRLKIETKGNEIEILKLADVKKFRIKLNVSRTK